MYQRVECSLQKKKEKKRKVLQMKLSKLSERMQSERPTSHCDISRCWMSDILFVIDGTFEMDLMAFLDERMKAFMPPNSYCVLHSDLYWGILFWTLDIIFNVMAWHSNHWSSIIIDLYAFFSRNNIIIHTAITNRMRNHPFYFFFIFFSFQTSIADDESMHIHINLNTSNDRTSKYFSLAFYWVNQLNLLWSWDIPMAQHN